ncbi:MAG: metallophosphoesterase [Deltaproteobacteria bacterium]|nr:metallophosphoesterase [Deltaproteobacteria bacterium]
MDPVATYRHLRGIARGMRRGTMFPVATRLPPRAAPGGSRVVRAEGGSPLVAIEETEHTVHVEGLREGVRVLQVTDVHLRGNDEVLRAVCAAVSRQTPDLLVLTGDVVTRGWSRDAADEFLGALPGAPLGKYAIIGNWEYWAGASPDTWRWFLDRHGIRLLLDEHVDLGGFQLVGTDDMLAGRPDLPRAFAGVDPARPSLVLTHSPALFPEIARAGVPLVLAGHTHGGQVVIPGIGSAFLPRASGDYPWGWYAHGPSWLYVCRGLGWSVAPFRWRAPPELGTVVMAPG